MREELEGVVRVLARHAWDGEVEWPQVQRWLGNFKGEVLTREEEELYALYALSRFMYFGRRLVREMLRSLYRDHFEAPIKQRLRKENRDTTDFTLIQELYLKELKATRFLGIGNPAESGAHLLYYFRQVNGLHKDLFADLLFAFEPKVSSESAIRYVPREPGVRRYVFFDDLVGSGTQAHEYLSNCLPSIKHESAAEVRYMCLFGTKAGMEKVNGEGLFQGGATCLFFLDNSYRAFDAESRYFISAPEWFNASSMHRIAMHYGEKLWGNCPLGYKSGQLLLSFSHNTPDNTLPIFWVEGGQQLWNPVFQRFGKVYS